MKNIILNRKEERRFHVQVRDSVQIFTQSSCMKQEVYWLLICACFRAMKTVTHVFWQIKFTCFCFEQVCLYIYTTLWVYMVAPVCGSLFLNIFTLETQIYKRKQYNKPLCTIITSNLASFANLVSPKHLSFCQATVIQIPDIISFHT